ncbi:hypothetical protein Leryth_016346 [Lithospermum erythrorhizon]|nr:hypothetical protein Leryth_016346 [Lithospermum erythrorhizon]
MALKSVYMLRNLMLPYISAHKYSYTSCGCIFNKARYYQFARGTQHLLYCSNDHNNNTKHALSSSNVESDQTPQDAFRNLISEFQMTQQERVGQTANEIKRGKVIIDDDPIKEWLRLDKRVNTYPSVRRFTAIGLGGEDFVNAMIAAAESVLEKPIPQDQVKLKVSSGGKYVSVNIGPLKVVSGEQVQAVYNAMRRDARVKCFL